MKNIFNKMADYFRPRLKPVTSVGLMGVFATASLSYKDNSHTATDGCIQNPAFPPRGLTPKEEHLAFMLWGHELDTHGTTLYFCENKDPTDGEDNNTAASAFAESKTIKFWRSVNWSMDYGDIPTLEMEENIFNRRAPDWRYSLFAHELAHLWQYQNPEKAGLPCKTYEFSLPAEKPLCREQEADLAASVANRFFSGKSYSATKSYKSAMCVDIKTADALLKEKARERFNEIQLEP